MKDNIVHFQRRMIWWLSPFRALAIPKEESQVLVQTGFSILIVILLFFAQHLSRNIRIGASQAYLEINVDDTVKVLLGHLQ